MKCVVSFYNYRKEISLILHVTVADTIFAIFEKYQKFWSLEIIFPDLTIFLNVLRVSNVGVCLEPGTNMPIYPSL